MLNQARCVSRTILLLAGVWITVLCGMARGDEVLQPGATPTPDQDSIASYGVSRVCVTNQVVKPDGSVYQDPRIDIVFVAMRSDGRCARPGGGDASCRVTSATAYDAIAASIITDMNASVDPSGTMAKRLITLGVQLGALPPGLIVGTPGITIIATPTAVPTPIQ